MEALVISNLYVIFYPSCHNVVFNILKGKGKIRHASLPTHSVFIP